ncbi:hypothetical protein ABZ746_02090 [Streptomyces sp. NPDC020096]
MLRDGTLVRTRRRTGDEKRPHHAAKHKAHGLLFLSLADEAGKPGVDLGGEAGALQLVTPASGMAGAHRPSSIKICTFGRAYRIIRNINFPTIAAHSRA